MSSPPERAPTALTTPDPGSDGEREAAYRAVIGAPAADRRDLFLATAARLGTPLGNPDFDLASARPGTFAVAPAPGMVDALERAYAAMSSMIFGRAPGFAEVLDSAAAIDWMANG